MVEPTISQAVIVEDSGLMRADRAPAINPRSAKIIVVSYWTNVEGFCIEPISPATAPSTGPPEQAAIKMPICERFTSTL